MEEGPRQARRRQRIELSREQLLDTAEQLFGDRGYHATGLKEVADRCEYSVGAIYQFFDSKDALYEAVLMRRGPEMTAGMERIVASSDPPDEQLLALAQLQASHFHRYPAWARLTLRVLRPGLRPTADVPDSFLHAFAAAIDAEADLFARGQAAGVLRAGDCRALARLFSSLVSAYHGLDPAISDDPADFSEQELGNLICDAFLVRR